MNLLNKMPALQAGNIVLPLRLVVGWTYFSAFWRRLVLENKLDPEAAGYIGEKFNHFLPNALLIKPQIEFLVSNPEWLWWSMLFFTLAEAVIGFAIIIGLFTRIMALGVFGLAAGILLGSGWLGTTCLDEWQIGVLGITSGIALFFAGGGYYAADRVLMERSKEGSMLAKLVNFASSLTESRKLFLGLGIAALLVTLATNQIFHGGVWGKLHNMSVKPHVEITQPGINENSLDFTVFRTEGADVYGSFLIEVRLLNAQKEVVYTAGAPILSNLPESQIKNHYVAKVKPGKNSLILPLGAKAGLRFNELPNLPDGNYIIELEDISGAIWRKEFSVV